MTVEQIKRELRKLGFTGSDDDLDFVASKIAERYGDEEIEPGALEAAVAAYNAAEKGQAASAPGATVFPHRETAIRAFEEAQQSERRKRRAAERAADAIPSHIEERQEQELGREMTDEEREETAELILRGNLTKILQREVTQIDIDNARRAAQALLGPDAGPVSDAFVSDLLARGDPRIVDALRAEDQDFFSANRAVEIVDRRTGERIYVSAATYDHILKNLTFGAQYEQIHNATWADSVRRGFFNENWYALLAHSFGITDPNQPPDQPPLDVGELPVVLGARVPEEVLRKEFVRKKLQEENPMFPKRKPKRFLSVGKLIRIENPLYRLWANPEEAVDANWWKENALEWDRYRAQREQGARAGEVMFDEGLRFLSYYNRVAEFEANLNEGMGPLIAIIAVHDRALADRAQAGLLTPEDKAVIFNKILRGVDPQNLGLYSDTLDFYEQMAGVDNGRRKIIQPNRDKIEEGFRELWRQWFMADPSDGQLQALIDQVANEFIAAQQQDREPDIQSTALKAVRSTDLYSQLFRNKPGGLTEEQYIGQFQRAGAELLGGEMPSQLAVQQGMQTGNVHTTRTIAATEKPTWENSSWLERVYQLAEIANRMT